MEKWPCVVSFVVSVEIFLVWSTFEKTVTKGAEFCLSNVVSTFPLFPAVEKLFHVWKMSCCCKFCCYCRHFSYFTHIWKDKHKKKQNLAFTMSAACSCPFQLCKKLFHVWKMTSRWKFCCYYRHFSYFTQIWTDRQKCEVCGKNERGSSFFHIWKSLWNSFSTAAKQVNAVVVLFRQHFVPF